MLNGPSLSSPARNTQTDLIVPVNVQVVEVHGVRREQTSAEDGQVRRVEGEAILLQQVGVLEQYVGMTERYESIQSLAKALKEALTCNFSIPILTNFYINKISKINYCDSQNKIWFPIINIIT